VACRAPSGVDREGAVLETFREDHPAAQRGPVSPPAMASASPPHTPASLL
jgi:hypothetical protein